MRSLLSAFGLFLGSTLIAQSVNADVWRLDPQHTEIRFSWDHLGVSRQSGRFTDNYGRLEFSPTNPAAGRVDVTMLLSGLSTGVEALDKALKSTDYFDARQFPRIRFVSTAVEVVSERTGRLNGDLTIKGQTRPVSLEVQWNFSGEHPLAPYNPVHRGMWLSGFTATGLINRSAWGITLGAPLISDEIRIEINAEFIRVEQ